MIKRVYKHLLSKNNMFPFREENGICLWLFLLMPACIFGQASPQDCFTAITVCSNTYNQTSNFNGYGNTQEIQPGGSTCFVNGETNSSWYIFKIKDPGTLYLDISPANIADDYDFLIYNFTNDSCTGIASGTSLPVRCNYSSTTGTTGLAAGFTGTSVNANGPPFCSPLLVSAGETYLLMVNNFTSTSSGYTLTFSGSATIFDTDAPGLDSTAVVPACSPDKVNIYFTENIDANSIAADGSDFIITGPASVTILNASLLTSNSIKVRFTGPLSVPGVYTVKTKTGTDGNTISDFCNNDIAINKSITFQFSFTAPVASISSIQNANCNGINGSATGSYTGGTGPFSFLWNSVPPQYGITATNLTPGHYYFTVTDVNGCSSIESFNIIASGMPQLATSVFDDVCGNQGSGQANASGSGGTAPYSYVWSTSPPQNTATATGLVAGNYTVTVTDANGCTASSTVSIDLIGKPVISISKTDVSCDGSIGGTATATVTGNSPFSYLWSTSPPQTTSVINSLVPGNYTVTVTDALGCENKNTVAIAAGQMGITVVTTDVNCGNQNTGTASVNVTGVIPPLNYVWNTSPVQTTSTATSLGLGTYQVVITDAGGCKDSLSVTINGPPAIVVLVTSNNADCNNNNGNAIVFVAGGIGPYTYLWNTTPVQQTFTATNLAAGVYNVTVTDNMGCTENGTAFIENINGPDGFISSVVDATCNLNNGSATATINTGVAPFSYLWNSVPPQFTATATNLAPGIYFVKIIDANGCISFLNVKINAIEMVTLLPVGVTDASCGLADGTATVIDSGGVGPFSFLWLTSPVQTGATALNLATGFYTAVVTDGSGCQDALQIFVGEEKANNQIGYKTGCLDGPTNFQGVTDYNGTVTWQWDFGDPFSNTDQSFIQNPSYAYSSTGTFTVTLYIDGGCATDTVVTQIYSGVKPAASFTNIPLEILSESPINFIYTGTPVQQWLWDFGDNNFSNDTSPVFTYYETDSVWITLIVTDEYGCMDTVTNGYLVEDAPQIFIPNSFTPNGDGKNDYFALPAHGLKECDVKIFSRWGNVVFQSGDVNFIQQGGWNGMTNGKKAPEGVYAYLISGKLQNNKSFLKTGTITVVY